MATDKLINQTQGGQLISGLTAIASEIASINTNAVRPNSTSTTENDIMVYGGNAYTAKDSGVSIETAQISGTLDTKLPTSKNIKTNVAGTAVLTNYPSTTPTSIQSVESTDTITQAIKKVEDNTRINNNNILSNTNDILINFTETKNVIEIKDTISNVPTGLIVTVNEDRSISVSGTATGGSGTIWLNIGTATMKAGTYKINPTSITGLYYYTLDNNLISSSTTTHTYENDITQSVWIACSYGRTYDATIYPMICLESLYNKSPNYMPKALSNSTLTPALVECVDKGSKNEFDLTKYDSVRDTTVTPLANGGATLTCTNASWTQYLKTLSCTAGKTYHLLFICDSLSASSGAVCKFFIRNGSSSGTSLGEITFENGKSYDLSITPTNSNIWFGLYLNNSATSATVTANLRIMLCSEAEYKTSQTYQPYAMSNAELTEKVEWHYTETRFTNTGTSDFENTGVSITVPANRSVEFYAYDRKDAAYLDKILVCDSSSTIGNTTIVSSNSIIDGFTDSQFWTLQTSGIVPTYNTSVTYYIWVKRKSIGSNLIGLAWRYIN